MTGTLEGRRILVTGASRGIGAACAQVLACSGATIVGAARNGKLLDEVMKDLAGSGHSSVSLDVGRPEAWQAAIDLLEAGGALHGLVHAAGVLGPIGSLDSVSPEAVQQTLMVNLMGSFLALHHVVPRLAAAGGGAAVLFSGGGGSTPLPRYDAYAMSKVGVVRLAENVAAVAREWSVTVNAVAPGFVATAMHDATLAAGPSSAGPDYYDRTQRGLREGGVSPQRAAELVCFLLGPQARGITGKLLSAEWDPWQERSFQRRLTTEPHLATLRRIDDQLFRTTEP